MSNFSDFSYDEPPQLSSTLGLGGAVKSEPYREWEAENKLRTIALWSVFGLIGLVLLGALGVSGAAALSSGDTTAVIGFCTSVVDKLVPVVTLIVGYLFGKHLQKEANSK
ncbi:hypothetical protein [Nocardia sp. NPDC059239]|uniref:hypothetical protein n=1 Tax=Nocardia sp. NPDC059239 TaxID=3346785 RepID=UPI0036C217E8